MVNDWCSVAAAAVVAVVAYYLWSWLRYQQRLVVVAVVVDTDNTVGNIHCNHTDIQDEDAG